MRILFILALVSAAGCGARSGLLGPNSDNAGGKAGSGGSTATGGTSSGGGGSPTTGGGGLPSGGSGGIAGAAGTGGIVEVSCAFVPRDPFELLSFPEGDTADPMMDVLAPGSPGSSATVAYAALSVDANFWHPELRVGKLHVSDPWPSGVAFDNQPVLYGFDAHANGFMSDDAEPGAGVALAFYHADEASPNVVPALKFRGFDVTNWQPTSEVVIDELGTVVYGLGPGASLQGKSYSGYGYAVAYRSYPSKASTQAEPRLALLDQNGGVVWGPKALAPVEDYPGRSSDVTWTGVTYLVATPFAECTQSDKDCFTHTLAVRRLDPSLGQGNDLAVAALIPALDPNAFPRRAMLASYAGHTWMAWSEAPQEPDNAPRQIRLAELDPNGNVLGTFDVGQSANPAHSISVAVNAFGVSVFWGETHEGGPPENVVGNSSLMLRHYALDGSPLDSLEIKTTQFYGIAPTLVALATPQSALVSWSGMSQNAGKDVTWLERLDCTAIR